METTLPSGAPKTGTTSVQRSLALSHAYAVDDEVRKLVLGGAAAKNPLGIGSIDLLVAGVAV